MHIVIIDTVMTTPPTGGAHTFLVGLCEGLTGRGHCVTIVTQPGPEKSLVASLRGAGATVREDLWRAVHLPEERAERLAKWVNELKPEVYVVSVSSDVGWLALPLLDPAVSTFSIVHSDGPTFYAPLRHYREFVDCAIGVSKETQQKIVAECHIPAERAYQIPYGVNVLGRREMEERVSDDSVSREALRAGYVGRVVQSQKRVLDLIPLVEEMRRRGAACEFHVIGDGPERARLEAGLEGLKAGGGVKFWGWLSPAKLRERLASLDALLLFSDCEGLPIALLEAMGHAVAPVVTRLDSGSTEIVRDGYNGFLVGVGDITAFADRLETLARDRGKLAGVKRAAWETGQTYTTGRMVDNYLDCFRQVAAAGSARARRERPAAGYPVMASCVSRYPFWLRKIKRRLLVSADAARALAGVRHH